MLPRPWNPNEINPALLTSSEYLHLCNENDKWHGEQAYNVTLTDLNQYEGDKRAAYRHVRRFKVNGIAFDLMVKTRRCDYAMRDADKELIRIDGEVQFYSDEEVKRLGFQPEEFTLSIFEGDTRVASAQDEWGCVLIMVAKEYRQFGLGTVIGKAARTLEPGKTSGGFTPGGARNFMRVHREFVRDALASGLYSKLVRAGTITTERAKAIVVSAKPQHRPKRDEVDLASRDPASWLLFHDDGGSFILYDRKLAHIVDSEKHAMFADRMIKGFVYCYVHDTRDGPVGRIKQFGAENPKLAAFMLALAFTIAKEEKADIWVEPAEYDLPGFQYGDEENVVGYRSRKVLSGPTIDYRAMARDEARFRASFDRYQEFEYRLQEMAHSKY
jgi:hypothetical protein